MEFQVNSETESYQSSSSVTVLSNGNFVVTWHSADTVGTNITDNDTYHIAAQLYDSNGDIIGSEFQVNSEIESYQYNPSIIALDDGGFIIAWDSSDTSGPGDDDYDSYIAAQIFDADANTVGSEFQVNSEIAGYQSQSEMTLLSDGNFIITWKSEDLFGDDFTDKDSSHISAQMFESDGTKIGSEFQVNSELEGTQSEPSIINLASGGFVITWESSDTNGSGNDDESTHIAAQIYDSSGNKLGSEFQVNTETESSQKYPTLVALNDGGFVAIWQSNDISGTGITDTDSYHIAAQVFDQNGTKVGDEFQVNTEVEGSQGQPSVISLSTGGFVVAWQSKDTSGTEITDDDSYHIAAQIFDAAGNKVDENGITGNELQINDEIESNQYVTSMVGLDNGDFLITWDSFDTDGTDISDSDLSHIAGEIFDVCDSTLFRLDSNDDEVCTESGYFFDLLQDGNLYGTQAIDYAVYTGYNFDDITISESDSLLGSYESIYDITYEISSFSSSSKNYTESLYDVERVEFDDANVALDMNINQSSGAAFAILYSAFNSVADSETASTWISASDKYFLDDDQIDQTEYIELAQEMLDYYVPTGIDNQSLVDLLYSNVLEDSGIYDESLIDYYLNELDNGTFSQASVLSLAAQTQENQDHYSELIGQGWQYNDYL